MQENICQTKVPVWDSPEKIVSEEKLIDFANRITFSSKYIPCMYVMLTARKVEKKGRPHF
jgi:hypothetical protein